MRPRTDGRTDSEIRPLRITPHCNKFAAGSALIELGDTRINCTVTVEDNVPFFLRNASPPQGWLTAEYAMLPAATPVRTRRERNFTGGRTQEIQRLIGRSLRGIVDLRKSPDLTFTVDCDVLQADGGTRTASITGAYVALQLAVTKLKHEGRIRHNPIINPVAAISVGIKDGRLLCDLNYREDSTIDTDMNVVMIPEGGVLEIQGTAEKSVFAKEQLSEIIDLATSSLQSVFSYQASVIEEGLSSHG